MITVQSSNIAALDHTNDVLTVRFHNGGLYEYQNVTEAEFEELLTAPSVGRAFTGISRNPQSYPYRRLS